MSELVLHRGEKALKGDALLVGPKGVGVAERAAQRTAGELLRGRIPREDVHRLRNLYRVNRRSIVNQGKGELWLWRKSEVAHQVCLLYAITYAL